MKFLKQRKCLSNSIDLKWRTLFHINAALCSIISQIVSLCFSSTSVILLLQFIMQPTITFFVTRFLYHKGNKEFHLFQNLMLAWISHDDAQYFKYRATIRFVHKHKHSMNCFRYWYHNPTSNIEYFNKYQIIMK